MASLAMPLQMSCDLKESAQYPNGLMTISLSTSSNVTYPITISNKADKHSPLPKMEVVSMSKDSYGTGEDNLRIIVLKNSMRICHSLSWTFWKPPLDRSMMPGTLIAYRLACQLDAKAILPVLIYPFDRTLMQYSIASELSGNIIKILCLATKYLSWVSCGTWNSKLCHYQTRRRPNTWLRFKSGNNV